MTQDDRSSLIQELRNNGVGRQVPPELLEMFPVVSCEERMIPTRGGETHIFLYYPQEERKNLPLYINIHGGGFIKGHRQQDIVFSKNICHNAGCAVIDIDYVPAPEQKYPYALHQCYDTIKWAWDHAGELGIDQWKIAVGGHSAGGNFAASVALMAKERQEFFLQLQILDYPCLDLHTPPELKRNAYTYKRLPPDRMRLYNDLYIDENERLAPFASPLFAPEEMLRGLPPALVITCGDDALGEEGEKYAFKLLEAGIAVTARRFLNSHHGFVVRRLDEYEAAEKLIFAALGQAFG